jgi:hypothetical protein
MQTSDPFTSFVAACVVPAAAATCMVWSFYLLAAGATPAWPGSPAASHLTRGATPARTRAAAR